MKTPATIEQRVERSAAWLDRQRPGWPKEINRGKLHLDDCMRCVLGQVFADDALVHDAIDNGYDYGLTLSGGSKWSDQSRWAAEHGFLAKSWPGADEIEALDVEWTRLVTERQAG